MDLEREYKNIYSLHENQIKNIFFTGVEIVGHPRLRGIRSPILSSVYLGSCPSRVESILFWVPFGVRSILHCMLSPIVISIHSGLSPYRCWVYSMLSPLLSSVHSQFSPLWVQSILSSVHLGLSPSGVESIRGWVPSGLNPFGVGSYQVWVHSGFNPIRGSVHSDKSPILGSVILGSVIRGSVVRGSVVRGSVVRGSVVLASVGESSQSPWEPSILSFSSIAPSHLSVPPPSSPLPNSRTVSAFLPTLLPPSEFLSSLPSFSADFSFFAPHYTVSLRAAIPPSRYPLSFPSLLPRPSLAVPPSIPISIPLPSFCPFARSSQCPPSVYSRFPSILVNILLRSFSAPTSIPFACPFSTPLCLLPFSSLSPFHFHSFQYPPSILLCFPFHSSEYSPSLSLCASFSLSITLPSSLLSVHSSKLPLSSVFPPSSIPFRKNNAVTSIQKPSEPL